MIYVKVTQLCLTLCDPTGCSTPDFPVHHQLPELDSEGRYEESQGLTGEGPWVKLLHGGKKREYFYLKINNILYVILLYSTSLPWKNVHFNFLMLLIQNYITWKQWIFSAHLKILVFLNRTSVELYLISSCPSHLVTWNFWECIHHKNFISKSNK